jgi:hypothetical protein
MAEFIHDLPCLACDQGARARREIIAAFLAVRAGRTPPRSSTTGDLPDACCRRREADVDAMVA